MADDEVAAAPAAHAVPVVHYSAQPFRPPFLSSPGVPPIPWSRWKRMFDDWLVAIGFPDTPASAERKAALLRASLGTEGYRLYVSIAPEAKEPYTEAVLRLERHFDRPASTIFARAQFTRCQQRPGQSISSYVAALREKAAKCDFKADQLNDRVRDQFVAWCSIDKVRQRLLEEPATKTLDELLELAITIEQAMAEAPALVTSSAASSSSTAPSCAAPLPVAVNSISSPTVGQSSSPSSCWNCGQRGHTARSDTCPARGKKCNASHKLGHYASVCRRGSAPRPPCRPAAAAATVVTSVRRSLHVVKLTPVQSRTT